MANIFEINRISNKITLGTTDTTINIASHTASKILALDASKNLEVVTIGSSLNYTRPTLNTIQDLRTSASPQFTAINLGHASDTTITRVSAGVIAVEGTTVMLVGDAPTSHIHDGRYYTETEIDNNFQPLDAELTSLAGLSYAAASFVKMTAANTFALRTIGQTADDLEGTIDHNQLANYASNKHFTQANITATGTITSGTWQGTTIAVNQGGTGQTSAQAAIDALSAVSGATDEHVLTKDTGTGQAKWKVAAGGADAFTVKIDAAATAGYIGAASGDGVLRTGSSLSYTDGGNFVTINAIQDIQTSATPTFAGLIIADGGTIGQSDGPLLTFNNTDNILKIMGCNVGFGNTDPKAPVDVYRAPSDTKGDNSIALSFGYGSDMWGMRLGASDSYSFHLDRQSSGTWYQALSIQRSNGNMGIGIWPLTKLTVEGTITLKERAGADADTAAYGQLWVKTATPNQLWFTDDGGNDLRIVPQDLQTTASPLFANIYMTESATSGSISSGQGIIWVKNDDPTTLWFRDDTGVEHQLAYV